MNTQPSSSKTPKAIATADYGWRGAQSPQSCGYIAPAVLRVVRAIEVDSVADLGSGNGALAGLLARELPGCRVAGIEVDAQGVELARRHHPAATFYRHGVEDDPGEVVAAQGRHFDCVVSTEVIEHLYSPHLLPRYARGLLRDGGWLIVSTPYHGYLKNLALSLTGSWDKHFTALWHGGHIKFWSRRTLSQVLQQEGFEVAQFVGVGRFPYLWKSMLLVARKQERK